MPSNLSPRLRWQPASLPVLEAGLDRLERAHRVIGGALTLWASRIAGFRWLDHGASEVTYRYCVARINGDKQAPRPTAHQVRACLQEVGESIDAEAYQALHILALSIAAAPPRAPTNKAVSRPMTSSLDLERLQTPTWWTMKGHRRWRSVWRSRPVRGLRSIRP